jgi:hypothetical protein
MYSTCLFCHSDLGSNEAIESFPVGRRLAFDAAKGRLWVICRKCERWNLTPLDERWEAVEQCERLFTQTRLRVSSDNIGLCRIREGLELVRIGNPLRPEMAAWRYGDQFGRRRRNYMITTGAVLAAGAGVLVAGPGMGILAGGGFGAFQLLNGLQRALRDRIVRARVAIPGRDHPAILRGQDVRRMMLTSSNGELVLLLPEQVPEELADPHVATQKLIHGDLPRWRRTWGTRNYLRLIGDDALRAAATVLPAVNMRGASRTEVADAVGVLERTPDPRELFLRASRTHTSARRVSVNAYSVTVHDRDSVRPPEGIALLQRLPKPVRLALEMAAHEDIERRAMEGELAILERAWRDAEEIAAISDSMFMPAAVDDKLQTLKASPTPANR